MLNSLFRAYLFVQVLACGAALRAENAVESGWVRSNHRAIRSAQVTLYQAGEQRGAGAVALGSAVTDADGFFRIPYRPPTDANAVLYLVADGPRATTRLATVLGTKPFPKKVTINERTTVATAYAMARFIVEDQIGGTFPGLQNAAGTFRNLANLADGDVGQVLGSAPNGLDTSTMRAFNSLANMLAGCVNSRAYCAVLFELATPPGGAVPENTLAAAVNIAHYSWQNSALLFFISRLYVVYRPALTAPPETWALAIKYVGNGHEFDGPGAMAIDEDGDVWVTNNYNFRRNHSLPTCGGEDVLKLTATGLDAPGAPFNGRRAGVNGAGFGITLDPSGNLWVGNFGFFGNTCPENRQPPANSVSKLSPAGTPLSPRDGFTAGCIASPQGTVSDPSGNIWIANSCGATITQYRAGNPDDFWVFDISAGQLADPNVCPSFTGSEPFDIAIDASGNAWVSDNGENGAFQLAPDGTLLNRAGAEAGIQRPLGITIDSLGNVWISNSAIMKIPCAAQGDEQSYGDLIPDLDHAAIIKLDSAGTFLGAFKGGGISIPWGIAVDGDDNIWVANFAGQRVSQFNGATGAPIAPHGYHNDGLVRNTGISIDSSGNVWLCNNWLTDPVQTNPGGDGLVVFIGLAAPVKTPLLGPPRQP